MVQFGGLTQVSSDLHEAASQSDFCVLQALLDVLKDLAQATERPEHEPWLQDAERCCISHVLVHEMKIKTYENSWVNIIQPSAMRLTRSPGNNALELWPWSSGERLVGALGMYVYP